MNCTDDRLLVLGETSTKLFCGIDRAEHHHGIAIVDDTGARMTKARISNDVDGLQALPELPAGVGDHSGDPIPVAIEKPHGLLVACLRATGRQVFAINPYAVSRYRDRQGVARKKSDEQDALILADIHRELGRTTTAAKKPATPTPQLRGTCSTA